MDPTKAEFDNLCARCTSIFDDEMTAAIFTLLATSNSWVSETGDTTYRTPKLRPSLKRILSSKINMLYFERVRQVSP
jgi:hypothetical protein